MNRSCTMFIVPLATILQSCAASSHWRASSQDDISISAIPPAIAAAWAEGNGRAIGEIYAETGTLVAGDGTVVRGPDSIARYHDEHFRSTLQGTRLDVTCSGAELPSTPKSTCSIHYLAPDIALMHTEGGIVGPNDKGLAPERRGVQSFVVVKSEGTWRVALFQNTRVLVRSPHE